jgi:hypothetical protein
MTTTAMTVFGQDDSKVSTNKAGAQTIAFLSQKDYGTKYGMKGQALKRAHLQYRIDRGTNQGNVGISTLITKGQVVCEKVRQWASGKGFDAKFTYAHELGVVATDPKAEARKLTKEQLLEIIAEQEKAAKAN